MATINYKDIYSVLSEQDQLHLLKYYGEPRLCHFIENESPRNVVFISISGRFALK